MYKQELADKIREAGYAAVIEVTNGLYADRFKGKVREACWGQRYLRNLTFKETEIDAGVIFLRNEGAIGKSKESLDFLYQLKGLKRDRSIQALEAVLSSDKSTQDLIAIAGKFHALVGRGFPLEQIFYPHKTDLPQFAEHVNLPTNVEEYHEAIHGVKGRILEEYIRILCQKMLPEMPEDAFVLRHEYESHGHQLDIDLIIIGEKERIRKGMHNSHDLREFSTTRREKEPMFRMPATMIRR